MADKDKKHNYLLWVIVIAAGVLILALCIGFYLLWRKISGSDIRVATTAKTVDDLRVSTAKLEAELRAKDDKIQELHKNIAELKQKNTDFHYQLKDIKKNGGQKQSLNKTQSTSGKKNKQDCDDDSGCAVDVDSL